MQYIGNWILEIRNLKFTPGFTLIELIIVVTIIGILSSLLLSNLVGIRGRIRDGQRKSDLTQIKQAIEIYRSDNGAYPTDSSGDLNLNACGDKFESGGNVYMQKIPCDPFNDVPYTYRYFSADGSTYTLAACLENINDAKKTDREPAPPCDGTQNWSYTLTNP